MNLSTLKILRKECGITQYDMASKVNISVRYLGRIERKQANPTFGLVTAICNQLGAHIIIISKEAMSK